MRSAPQYCFGPFVLQPDRRRLCEDGVAVALGARAFDLLVVLVEHNDRIMGKEELLRHVWPGNAVEENNITVNMSALRKALRDQAGVPRYIQTISGRGYRFIAALATDAGPSSPAPAALQPPEMPSIAVLPFAAVGGNVAQEHLGDGIAEDIISELSRHRWLTVIARNSSFTYKGAAVEIGEVARQFGVRYVLDGSVRQSGGRVRVNIHLIDATTGTHLLAERYDRELADLFALQDEITSLITTAVRPALYEAEQARSLRKHPDSIDAWAAYQRGVLLFSRYTPADGVQARIWFDRAVALDPGFAPGYYGLALIDLHDGSGHLPSAVADWQPRGEALARRAVQLDGRDSHAHSILGLAYMVRGDHAGALEATTRALALNPNDATAHGTLGAALVFMGRTEEGLRELATSVRLSPRDPRMRVRQAHIGLGHYFSRQYEEAEAVARRIMREWPTFSFGPRLLAMVMAETGRAAEARAAFAAAVALVPAPFDDFTHANMPWYRPSDHARVLQSLRQAGCVFPAPGEAATAAR